MASIIQNLYKQNNLNTPSWLPNNVCYEVLMGSLAYGVSTETSDIDVYGFCIPKKEIIFPHLSGEILGFDVQTERFEQYQEHHIKNSNKKYDITIFNIVKYFNLCMNNNPNIIDSLFVPTRCIVHSTAVGNLVRDNRHLFLSKVCWPKFKGYAYSQLHKAEIKTPKEGSNRDASVKQFGWDVKFGYHIVRLISEVEQILQEETLDLEKNKEHLKAIRKGEVSLEEVKKWFYSKEKILETLYVNSKLRSKPDSQVIKKLLLECLEMHYGDLSNAVIIKDPSKIVLQQIYELLIKHVEK